MIIFYKMLQYCEIFDRIKSALEDVDRNVRKFDTIKYWSGNENIANAIAERLQICLLETKLLNEKKQPVQESLQDLRKAFMFLILNNDTEYPCDITLANTRIVHIIKICPLIPRCLLPHIIFACNMDVCFYEFLTFGPPWLTHHYIEEAEIAIKRITKDTEALRHIGNMLYALVSSLCFIFKAKRDSYDYNIAVFGYNSYIAKFLHQILQNLENHRLRPEKRPRYLCYTVANLLSCALRLVQLYMGKNIMENCDIPRMRVYILQKPKNVELPANCVFDTDTKQRVLLKIYSTLMNALSSVLENVGVGAFVDWIEFKSDMYCNMQREIGIETFELLKMCKDVKTLKHAALAKLEPFAIEIKPIEERVVDMKIGDLLIAIEDNSDSEYSGDEQIVCFNELFKRDIIFGNTECLQTILTRKELLDINHCKKILEFLRSTIDMKRQNSANEHGEEQVLEEDFEFPELLAIFDAGWNNLSIKQKLEVLIERPKSVEIYIDFHKPDFYLRSKVFWNKFTRYIKLSKFYELCLEDARFTWTQLFFMCCTSNKLIPIYVKALNDMKPFGERYQGLMVRNAVVKPKVVCGEAFITLATIAAEHCIKLEVDSLKFWYPIFLLLVDYGNDKHFHLIAPILQVFLDLKNKHSTDTNMPDPFAGKTILFLNVIILRLMDTARWDIGDYSDSRAKVLGKACELLVYDDKASIIANELQQNQFFRELKMFEDKSVINRFVRYYFLKSIRGQKVKFSDVVYEFAEDSTMGSIEARRNIILKRELAKTLLACHEDEAIEFLGYHKVKPIMFRVMDYVTRFVAVHTADKIIENYLYTFNAFIKYLEGSKDIMKDLKCGMNLKSFLNLLKYLLNTAPQEAIEGIYAIYARYFHKLVQAKIITSIDVFENMKPHPSKDIMLDMLEKALDPAPDISKAKAAKSAKRRKSRQRAKKNKAMLKAEKMKAQNQAKRAKQANRKKQANEEADEADPAKEELPKNVSADGSEVVPPNEAIQTNEGVEDHNRFK